MARLIRLIQLMVLIFPLAVAANEVDIVGVKIWPVNSGKSRVDVTLKHADTGWDHYADGWEILDSNRKVIATRVLYHPHVDEQPFTRSLYDVTLPADSIIYIRAHDKVHGYSNLYEIQTK